MIRPATARVAATLALVALAVAAAPAGAQVRKRQPPPQAPAGNQKAVPAAQAMRNALNLIRTDNAWTLEQQRSICEVPAPPFKEAARAEEMARRFRALGYETVRIDAVGNVIAERAGRVRRPVVVLSAHLDTVFPEGTDVTVRRTGTVMRGPGIADDCRGLAILLSAAKALDAASVRTEGTIVFVGTVGEEGLGNLRGVRHLLQRELGRVDHFITVDLSGFELSHRAVGSHRYEIRFSGPGGHSFEAFGMPNPTHALGRAIATISDLRPPATPKTTFNVGIVRGGTSVNAIAPEAAMSIDLRSESPAELGRLDAAVREAVAAAAAAERARWPGSKAQLTVTIDTLGIRPAGSLPASAPIVRTALDAARQLGVRPTSSAHSTDANLPLSMGIPALAIGHGGRGSGEHSLAEAYDDGKQGYLGVQWAMLTAVMLAGTR
jgi:acetylornithine deacetylase/succinyl-diaminopimelate desuccinylase-like protein